MKSAFFIIISLLLLSCCRQGERVDGPPISVQVNIIRKYDTIYDDTIKRLTNDLRISIINISSKPVSFWIMSCGFLDNFILSKSKYEVKGYECLSTAPIIKHLDPKDSIAYYTRVYVRQFYEFKNNDDLKVGFIYLDATKCNNGYYDCKGDLTKWTIIWSNAIIIKR